jgi:hypothetical protein
MKRIPRKVKAAVKLLEKNVRYPVNTGSLDNFYFSHALYILLEYIRKQEEKQDA